ncbi:hypothetical protein ACVRXS_03670 [Streptococcus orisratti]|nr:hypothetical protein [Streptococcus orisratti]
MTKRTACTMSPHDAGHLRPEGKIWFDGSGRALPLRPRNIPERDQQYLNS